MKLNAMIVGMLMALVPVWGAYAQDEEEGDKKDDNVIVINGLDDLDDFSINLDGIGDLIERVVEAIGEALEGSGDILNRVLHSSDEMQRADRYGKAEAGDARPVDETRSTGDRPDIEIYNLAGTIEVIGWDKNEIHIEGTIGEDVEELEFDVSRNRAEIRVKLPRKKSSHKVRSELTIHVPHGSSIEVESVSASVTLSGLKGNSVDIETVSGAITVNDSEGDVEVETTSGRVTVAGSYEEIKIETVSGRIEISGNSEEVSAESISGSLTIGGVEESVDAETISGPITIDAASLEELDAETISGRITFTGMAAEDAEFEINTLSGSVILEFDKAVAGEYNLQSFSGNIRSDYGGKVESKGKFLSGKELHFTYGDGDANITIETFSGSIAIRAK